MTVTTVFMVGVEQLPLVPEYLNLGSVVVVAPDRDILRRWRSEHLDDGSDAPTPRMGALVDLDGRRIVSEGSPLPLSDLEFRVLSHLLEPIGRAVSFGDLREIGWGSGPELSSDIYALKALIQRLRAKLAVAGGLVGIEAVRGYGFRAVRTDPPMSLVTGGRAD